MNKYSLLFLVWVVTNVAVYAQDTARPSGGGGEREMTEADLVVLTKQEKTIIAKELKSQLLVYSKAVKNCNPAVEKQLNMDQVFHYLSMLELRCNRVLEGINEKSCDDKSCEALECLRKEGALSTIERLLSNAKVVSFWRDQSQFSSKQVLKARKQILQIIAVDKRASKL